MAKEEVGKQRIHVDLVGVTSMGTTMPKGTGGGSDLKARSKTKSDIKAKARANNPKASQSAGGNGKKKGGDPSKEEKKKK